MLNEEIIFSYTEKFKTIIHEPISSSFGIPILVQCSKLGSFTIINKNEKSSYGAEYENGISKRIVIENKRAVDH